MECKSIVLNKLKGLFSFYFIIINRKIMNEEEQIFAINNLEVFAIKK